MNVFSQFAKSNNLNPAQVDETVNSAFDTLQANYGHFMLSYDESGVCIENFDSCSEEETVGFSKAEIENSLTDKLISIASKSL